LLLLLSHCVLWMDGVLCAVARCAVFKIFSDATTHLPPMSRKANVSVRIVLEQCQRCRVVGQHLCLKVCGVGVWVCTCVCVRVCVYVCVWVECVVLCCVVGRGVKKSRSKENGHLQATRDQTEMTPTKTTA
jgi:hypothetical protein